MKINGRNEEDTYKIHKREGAHHDFDEWHDDDETLHASLTFLLNSSCVMYSTHDTRTLEYLLIMLSIILKEIETWSLVQDHLIRYSLHYPWSFHMHLFSFSSKRMAMVIVIHCDFFQDFQDSLRDLHPLYVYIFPQYPSVSLSRRLQ
jgi:hypothetical protein